MAKPSNSVQAAFGLFDDDSSDNEEQITPSIEALPILPLTQLAISSTVTTTEEKTNDAHELPSTIKSLYAPWDDVPPLHVGPIELVTTCTDVGGNRGYVAAQDLEAGTQVLIEQVYVPWPEDVDQSDPTFFIATLETILSRTDYKDIVQHLSHLFPQRLCDLPEELLTAGRAKYDHQIDELRQNFQTLDIEHDVLLQNVFAMQCNAFDSGVFLYNAMFNHDCNPNCVKFTPEVAEAGVSEVRVAKKVLKGEPLTISYLYPREKSRETRQQNLREQFGFVCKCALCQRGDSVLPRPTPTEGASIADMRELEKIVAAAEEMLRANEAATQVLSIALEALSDALEIVAHDHIVFIRIHKLVADSCDLLLHAKPNQDVREYAILFLRSNYELLELQRTYLNDDHIDLARTLNDMSQGIQLLLSYDSKVLLEEFPEWKDFRQASFVENQYRQEYRRLKRLYE